MPSSLPRSTPADQRVDPAAILSFLDAVDERPDIEMHSLMVVRHGRVVAEGSWAPYSAGRPQLLYSLSKSFTSTAAAFAQAEGLLDLDDTVISHFAEFDADITDPRSRSVKVRHVASMAAGYTREMLAEAITRDREEPVRGFLLIPPDRDPGTVFAYSQPCTYALASIIQRNAGMPLTRYLRPRLFDPLGIGHVGWHTFPPGREQGFSGLHARTEDIAKLGLLYVQGGRWEGAQLIPWKWVAEATDAAGRRLADQPHRACQRADLSRRRRSLDRLRPRRPQRRNHPGGRLRRLARPPHPASRGHLPGNPAPDGHHLLPPRTHRQGRVAPSTAHPQQAPAPALPRLGTPRGRPATA
jgi:CubicO group peptidase (beta-lactamase class C family)